MNALDRNEKRTLLAVGAIIVAGGVAGVLLGRSDSGADVAAVAVTAPVATQPAAIVTPATAPPAAAPMVAPAMLGEADLAKLGEESMAGPAALRVAAIERLAKAPREQALPLLKRALLNGDPAVDRPAALAGLRELARSQGDGDERIRDTVREVIYHGDDDAFAADAQETLDTIAASEDASSSDTPRRVRPSAAVTPGLTR